MTNEAVGHNVDAKTWFVDQPMVDAWADISADANPLHVDPGFAARSQFGRTIAHGHLTVALVIEHLMQRLKYHAAGGFVLRSVQFRAPVLVGEVYRTTVEADTDRPGLRVAVVDSAARLCLTGEVRVSCNPPAMPAVLAAAPSSPRSTRDGDVLWADDLSSGRAFAPAHLSCDATTAERYTALLRRDAAVRTGGFPPGLAAALARLSYLSEHRMPPGAVLLGMDIRLGRVPAINDQLVARAQITEIRDRRPDARRVTIVSQMNSQHGAAQRVRVHLRWPRRAPAATGSRIC